MKCFQQHLNRCCPGKNDLAKAILAKFSVLGTILVDTKWGKDQWLQCGWDESKADATTLKQCSKVMCTYYCLQMDGCKAAETATRVDSKGRSHTVCSFSSTCTEQGLSKHSTCTAYLGNFPQHCKTISPNDCSACQTCLDGFVLQGSSCVQTCDIGMYADTSATPTRCRYCTASVANCDVCSIKEKCKACEPTFLLSDIVGTSNEYKQCVKTCPAGTFADDRDGDGTNERCTKCGTGCKSCSAANDCTDCGAGFYRHDGNGDGKYDQCAECKCKAEQYSTGTCKGTETDLSTVCKSCTDVNADCLTCTKVTECQKCNSGYYLASQKYLPPDYKTKKQGKCDDHGWCIVPQGDCQAAAEAIGVPSSSKMGLIDDRQQKRVVTGCHVDVGNNALYYNPKTTTKDAKDNQALICQACSTPPNSKCVKCTLGSCASTTQYNDISRCLGSTTKDDACPECSSAMANCVQCIDSKHCTKCAAGTHLSGPCETPDTYRRASPHHAAAL